MTARTRLLLLIPLLIASLACQAVTRLLPYAPPSATPTPPATSTPSATATPLPTSTATLTPLPPTFTPTWTPSPTSTASPTVTIVVTPSALQLNVFEELWKTVDENYLYPDFNGLDWNAVHEEYRQRIEAGLTNQDFYAAMEEMIFRLGDDHSVFLSPDQVAQEEAEFAGENDYVGVGILTFAVPERQRISIILVFPGSPAEQVGLQSHDDILAADGQPILDENGIRTQLLRGPEGSTVTLTVETPGQEPREVTLTRRRVTGAVPVPYSVLTTPEGKRVGYILLPTFADDTVDGQVGKALQAMTAEAPLDGLILDNRMNTGGTNTVTSRTLGYFTHGVVGNFVSRKERPQAMNVIGTDIRGSSKVPLVVLVGQGTVSFGEIFSGILQDIGRAYLIGETTDGNVEILWGYDFEDGSRAWIAHDTFRPLNHPDQNWEQTGIIPDLTVLSNWDEVTLETDPVIKASLEHFDGQKSP